jgi:enamine deaminase RidA (YjgF/YER057c/UK114 family)
VPKGDQRIVGRRQLAARLAKPVTLGDGPGVFLVAASGQVPRPPEQARIACAQAWQNIQTTLSQAGASLSDIVSVRQWLTSEEHVRGYVEARSKFITHKPAFMLGVIPGLVRPDFLIEIEVVAAVPAGEASRDQ